MKIPDMRELQQVAFNHSSGIDLQDFMNLYKTCTAKAYSFFIFDQVIFHISERIF